MGVQTGLLTVEEFLKLPDPKEGHLELHHGEVVVMPGPKLGHQRIQGRIMLLLAQLTGGHGLVLMELGFRPTSEHELWQADIGYISPDRNGAVGDDEYLPGAPDLVVEVLSPSNTVDEINDRMAICLDNGCASFWVVDPKRKRVSVTEGNVTRHYSQSDMIPCPMLGGEIPCQKIFE